MQTLQTALLVVQIFVALGLIAIILIQHGKGADAGAAFGSGASSTVFGSRGSGNFLTKTTTVLAILFLANSMSLGYLATHTTRGSSLMEQAAEQREKATMTDASEQAPAEETGTGQDMPSIPAQ